MAQIVPFFFRKTPAVAETDFSGTIVAVGDKVLADQGSSDRTAQFRVGPSSSGPSRSRSIA